MVISNNLALANYGFVSVSDIANRLARISAGNQERITSIQSANSTNGVIVDLRQRISRLSTEATSAEKVSERESIRTEISSIQSSLSNLLVNPSEAVMAQANQVNSDVLSLLA